MKAVGIKPDIYKTIAQLAVEKGCSMTEVASDFLRKAIEQDEYVSERNNKLNDIYSTSAVAEATGTHYETARKWLEARGKKSSDGFTGHEILLFINRRKKKRNVNPEEVESVKDLISRYGQASKQARKED